jgi:replicative DNA helicase
MTTLDELIENDTTPEPPDVTPGYDLVAERGVLGAMMLDRTRIADAIDVVQPAHYYRPAHELIHRAIVDLNNRGDAADPITVGAELTRRGELARAGGSDYLWRLVSPGMAAANVVDYAEIVAEKWEARQVEKTLGRARAELLAGRPPQAVMATVQADLLALEDQQPTDDTRLVREGLQATLDKIEHLVNNKGVITGVPTGLADLDTLTQGLQPHQLVIVAARPAMGKSTLALDFARNAAIKHKLPSAFFSLEMSRDEINMRLLSAECRVGLHHMRSGDMTDEDWTNIARKLQEIEDSPLFLDDSPNLSLAQIRAKARRLKDRHGLKLLVVDYLQLMQTGSAKRAENRQLEVSEMSRGLKLLAKELELPVVALSQLNRGPEQRQDKRPVVSDLRESGSIENDADVVILLHREDAYVKESPRAGEADVHVAKHRNGPTAMITCAFQGHFSRFVDMAQS